MRGIVHIKGVSKTYRGTQALRDVTLTLRTGKIIGLLGPNGSGKTTLIKIIAGMIRNFDGDLLVDRAQFSHKSKSLISYLPDTMIMNGEKTVKGLARYYGDMFGDFSGERFDELVKRFRINGTMKFKQLSKGNKEKLQLALILSRDAKVYLFDEPIGGVDPAVRQVILDTIMEFRRPDAAIVLSTHQIYDVEALFDEVIFLKEGEVVLHEPTHKLLKREQKPLVDVFKEVFRYVE